jgi:crotonobetainyl-CoA:carnitine CoA-transferase CaiB-like acyl-CoA transferase
VKATATELQSAGVPAEVVQSIEEVVHDPQARSRGMFMPQQVGGEEYDFVDIGIRTGQPLPIEAGRAPSLGEDSAAILEELGCAAPEIRRLVERNVIHLNGGVLSHASA